MILTGLGSRRCWLKAGSPHWRGKASGKFLDHRSCTGSCLDIAAGSCSCKKGTETGSAGKWPLLMIPTGLGSRRCGSWQIKSLKKESVFLVRSDQVQVVLACLVSPKHCECEAHSRRRNGGSARSIILPEHELLGWRRKAGHRRDTVTFSASSPDIRAVDHRK